MIFNGRFLREERLKNNLSQRELGEKVGVSGVAIMRYENNQRKPNQTIFSKLCQELGVAPVRLALGMSQEEWDAVDPRMQELMEFGPPDNITERELTYDFYIPGLTTKENGIFNDLAKSFQQLNTSGMEAVASHAKIVAGNPEFRRTETQLSHDGKKPPEGQETPSDGK